MHSKAAVASLTETLRLELGLSHPASRLSPNSLYDAAKELSISNLGEAGFSFADWAPGWYKEEDGWAGAVSAGV